MNNTELQKKLSKNHTQTVWLYLRTVSNEAPVLFVLNFNGTEIARKEFTPKPGQWNLKAIDKLRCQFPPAGSDPIDVEPADKFILSLKWMDYITHMVESLKRTIWKREAKRR